MKTCNNCFHKDVCFKEHLASDIDPRFFRYDELDNVEDECENFKDENKILNLPCQIGETIFEIEKNCFNCPNFRETEYEYNCDCKKDYSLFEIDFNKECIYIITKRPFTYNMIEYINQSIFLSHEDAINYLKRNNIEIKKIIRS